MYFNILKSAKKLFRIGSNIKKSIEPNVKTLNKSRKLKVVGTPYTHITNAGYHFGGVLTMDTSVGFIDGEQDAMMFDAWHTEDTIMEEIWKKYNLFSPLIDGTSAACSDFILYKPPASPLFFHPMPSLNTNLLSEVFSPFVPPALIPALDPRDVRSNTVRTVPSFFRTTSSTSPAINQSIPPPGRNRIRPYLAVNIPRPVALDRGIIKRRNIVRRVRNLRRWIADFTLCPTAYERKNLRRFKNIQRTVPITTLLQRQNILKFCRDVQFFRPTRNQRQVGALGPAENIRSRLHTIHRDQTARMITSIHLTKMMRRKKSGVRPVRRPRT